MITIHKYQVKAGVISIIQMPKDSQILTVQTQHGSAQLWAMVDTSKEIEDRSFYIVGTGTPIEADVYTLKYINTFQIQSGDFVFHLFEVTE